MGTNLVEAENAKVIRVNRTASWINVRAGGGISKGIDMSSYSTERCLEKKNSTSLSAGWMTPMNDNSRNSRYIRVLAIALKMAGFSSLRFAGVEKPLPI